MTLVYLEIVLEFGVLCLSFLARKKTGSSPNKLAFLYRRGNFTLILKPIFTWYLFCLYHCPLRFTTNWRHAISFLPVVLTGKSMWRLQTEKKFQAILWPAALISKWCHGFCGLQGSCLESTSASEAAEEAAEEAAFGSASGIDQVQTEEEDFSPHSLLGDTGAGGGRGKMLFIFSTAPP